MAINEISRSNGPVPLHWQKQRGYKTLKSPVREKKVIHPLCTHCVRILYTLLIQHPYSDRMKSTQWVHNGCIAFLYGWQKLFMFCILFAFTRAVGPGFKARSKSIRNDDFVCVLEKYQVRKSHKKPSLYTQLSNYQFLLSIYICTCVQKLEHVLTQYL